MLWQFFWRIAARIQAPRVRCNATLIYFVCRRASDALTSELILFVCSVSVTVDLSELPGELDPSGDFTVRDLWEHREIPGALNNGALTLSAASQDSEFYVIRPKTLHG